MISRSKHLNETHIKTQIKMVMPLMKQTEKIYIRKNYIIVFVSLVFSVLLCTIKTNNYVFNS